MDSQMHITILKFVLCIFFHIPFLGIASDSHFFTSKETSFKVVKIASGLNRPWSISFLPSGDFLITERRGSIKLIDHHSYKIKNVTGLPDISPEAGQGGLLDLALDPQFSSTRYLCFSFVGKNNQKRSTEIACGYLDGSKLNKMRVIFSAKPKFKTKKHFGSRLIFSQDGYLYATLGDHGVRPEAQNLKTHPGSVIRLHPDGKIPVDNPFFGQSEYQPEIFAYGNRNPQGLTINSETGEIWMHEHGPRGGDELNKLIAAGNYGWPEISYGKEYYGDIQVGSGTHQEGMLQPIYYWTPSIAPSGMTFYNGNDFPEWKGSLFIGALKEQSLIRLEIKDNQVVYEEKLLQNEFGRIRDVATRPNGSIFFITDEANGKLFQIQAID